MGKKPQLTAFQKQHILLQSFFERQVTEISSVTHYRIVKLTWGICLLSDRVMWFQKWSQKLNTQEAKTVTSKFVYFQGFVCQQSNQERFLQWSLGLYTDTYWCGGTITQKQRSSVEGIPYTHQLLIPQPKVTDNEMATKIKWTIFMWSQWRSP